MNAIPTLSGALWNGNSQLALKRDLKNLSTNTIVNTSTILTSSLISFQISSVFGDFSVALTSTLSFQPSLGGVAIDLGLGGFLGGLAGGIGGNLFNTALGGAALGTGIAALTMSRQNNNLSPNINSNVFETINGTSQLQVSTLGSPEISIQRFVSSVSPNSVPGREVFVSTVIPAGTTCIRSFSDPLYLANPSTLTSSIQSFGQWVSLEESPVFTASNIEVKYSSSPAILATTRIISTFVFPTPFAGLTSNVSSLKQPLRTVLQISTTNIYPSTSYNQPLLNLPATTDVSPFGLTLGIAPSGTQLIALPNATATFINASAIPTATYDVVATGSGAVGFWLPPSYDYPAPADIVVLPNTVRRVFWNFTGGNTSTLITPVPLPVSTIIATNQLNDTGLFQLSNLSLFSTNQAFAFGGNVTMQNDMSVTGTLTVNGNLNATIQTLRTNSIITSTLVAACNITGQALIQGNQVSAVIDVSAPSVFGTLVSGSNVNATNLMTAPSSIFTECRSLVSRSGTVFNTGVVSSASIRCSSFQVTGSVVFNTIQVANLQLSGLNILPSFSFLTSDLDTTGDYVIALPLGNAFFQKQAIITYTSFLVGSADIANPSFGNFQFQAADGYTLGFPSTTTSSINFGVPPSGGDAFTSGSMQMPLFLGTHYTTATTTLTFRIKHIQGRNLFFNRGGNNLSFFAIL